MPYTEISADQGFLLEFALSEDLAPRVVAQNNKAALFGLLEALAKIQGCIAVYWGMASGTRKRVVLVAGFKDGIRRSQLPLDRILSFLASPPRIFETIFPSGLDALNTRSETTIDIVRYSPRLDHQSDALSYWQLADNGEAPVNNDMNDEEWVDCQTSNSWAAVDIQPSTRNNKSSVDWLGTRRRILSSKTDPYMPKSQPPVSGCLAFTLIPQKYSVPSAVSYYQHINRTSRLVDVHPHRTGSQQKCQPLIEDIAHEDGWVLVT